MNTITSVVDETASKINPIRAIEVKPLMDRESFDETYDKNDNKSENNFINLFLDDEGLEGTEYLNYLEKTVLFV